MAKVVSFEDNRHTALGNLRLKEMLSRFDIGVRRTPSFEVGFTEIGAVVNVVAETFFCETTHLADPFGISTTVRPHFEDGSVSTDDEICFKIGHHSTTNLPDSSTPVRTIILDRRDACDDWKKRNNVGQRDLHCFHFLPVTIIGWIIDTEKEMDWFPPKAAMPPRPNREVTGYLSRLEDDILKDWIWFDDFMLSFECDLKQCTKDYLEKAGRVFL